ncbi:polysaccharide pyruvyl transferase-domain-containing protein [Hyaloraphidium curvatum]|nr:polysaccharide pyruvyl transferase-domain-containing protein [Hyaloraphidium curvatum]
MPSALRTSFIVLTFFALASLLWLQTRFYRGGNGSESCAGHLPPAPDVVVATRAKLLATMRQALAGVKHAALVKLPMHQNKGDSAIAAGEVEVLRLLGINVVHYGIENANDDEEAALIDRLLPNDTTAAVLYHGGGNLGDVWPLPHRMRLSLMSRLRHRRSVLLPQSVQFSSDAAAAETVAAFATMTDLTLVARDAWSFRFLVDHFSARHRVFLSPDSAFALGPLAREKFEVPSVLPPVDVLYFLRTDKEAVHRRNISVPLASRHPGRNVTVDDWLLYGEHLAKGTTDPPSASHERTALGLQFLARAKVVVTDRLHGHILSLLLDVPHVLLDNNYGKVMRYHSIFTLEADNVRAATDLNDAGAVAEAMLAVDWKAEREMRCKQDLDPP